MVNALHERVTNWAATRERAWLIDWFAGEDLEYELPSPIA